MIVQLLNCFPVSDKDFFDLLLDVAGEFFGLVALVLLLH